MKNSELMTVRPMGREDPAPTADLFKKCFARPWTLDALRETLQVPGYCQLLLVIPPSSGRGGEEIVGYAGYKAAAGEADISNVCIRPDCRGRGLGEKLLKTLLGRAEEEGIRAVYLEVRQSNTPAVRLYHKAGFRVVGSRKNYYTDPAEDALLMVRESARTRGDISDGDR